ISYSNARLRSATGVTLSNDDQLGPGHVRGAALRARSGSRPGSPPARRIVGCAVVYGLAGSSSTSTCTGHGVPAVCVAPSTAVSAVITVVAVPAVYGRLDVQDGEGRVEAYLDRASV